MARPRTPRISQKRLIRIALRVIDKDGLAAFSLKRLADELQVHESSVYHHYRYKHLILEDVVRLVLSDIDVTTMPTGYWKDYLLHASIRYYRAVVAHPNLVPVLQASSHPPYTHAVENHTATMLFQSGFPARYVVLIREQLESLILGAVQYSGSIELFTEVDVRHAALVRATRAAGELTPEERIFHALRAFLDGLELQLPLWQQSVADPEPAVSTSAAAPSTQAVQGLGDSEQALSG